MFFFFSIFEHHEDYEELHEDYDLCPSTKQYATRGVSTTICCPVSGFPPPEIFWELANGTVLKSGSTILPITPEKTDFGSYTCIGMGLKERDSVIVTIDLREEGLSK